MRFEVVEQVDGIPIFPKILMHPPLGKPIDIAAVRVPYIKQAQELVRLANLATVPNEAAE